MDSFAGWGAFCFGLVVGWASSGSYVGQDKVTLKWISSLIGIVGGAAVVGLFNLPPLFGVCCIGLSVAFFPGLIFQGAAGRWLGGLVVKELDKDEILICEDCKQKLCVNCQKIANAS